MRGILSTWDSGFGIWDLIVWDSGRPNPKSRIPNPESRIPNPTDDHQSTRAPNWNRRPCTMLPGA
jgi:hypothetical protein